MRCNQVFWPIWFRTSCGQEEGRHFKGICVECRIIGLNATEKEETEKCEGVLQGSGVRVLCSKAAMGICLLPAYLLSWRQRDPEKEEVEIDHVRQEQV